MALLFVPVLGANFAIVSRYFILIGTAVLGGIIGATLGKGIFATVFSGNTEASALLLAAVLFGGGGAVGGWWLGRRLAA